MAFSLPILTNSSVGTYLQCQRRYEWAYVRGIRRTVDAARLRLGAAYHAALARINHGESVEAALGETNGLEEPDRSRCAAMVIVWEWRWREDRRAIEVLAVERPFRFRLGRSRLIYAGKIDAIVRLADGRVAVGEYKTTDESILPDSDYWPRLTMDRQISGYLLGARALGFPAETVIYDAARKPRHRPRLLDRGSGERENSERFTERLVEEMRANHADYFARREIARVPGDLDSFARDVKEFARMIRASMRSGHWPRNTDSCRRWGVCPYFGPCSAFHDPAGGIPDGYEQVDDPHIELREDHDDSDPDAASAD